MKLRAAAEWMWPALTLAALPKCPACLAAYLAVSTGLAISLPAAAYLRVFIVIACGTALLRLAGKKLRRHGDCGRDYTPTYFVKNQDN